MIGITNSGFGGSGGIAFIQVTYPVGSSCTCTNGTRTYRAKDTSGSCVFNVKDPGNWTVSCTDGTDSDSKTVTVANYDSISVKLAYESIEKLGDEVESWGLPMLISMAIGDFFWHDNSTTYKSVRTSNEPVIFIPAAHNNVRWGWSGGVITSTPVVVPHSYESNYGALTLCTTAPGYITTQNGHKLYFSYNTMITTSESAHYYMSATCDGTVHTRDVIASLDDQGINFGVRYDTLELATFGTCSDPTALMRKLNYMLDQYAIFTNAQAV